MNEVFVLHRKIFSFLYLFLIELRTYQRQTLCGVLTESRFLKKDFNGSKSSSLDSWLSWVCFNLIVGSREFDPSGSHHFCKYYLGLIEKAHGAAVFLSLNLFLLRIGLILPHMLGLVLVLYR
jgi:hypothetical protein